MKSVSKSGYTVIRQEQYWGTIKQMFYFQTFLKDTKLCKQDILMVVKSYGNKMSSCHLVDTDFYANDTLYFLVIGYKRYSMFNIQQKRVLQKKSTVQ